MELMNDMQRYIPGAVSLPGVNVASHVRCGDTDRDRAAARVSEAYARGFIDKDEAESRHDAIGQATLGAHLELLVNDIPPITRWRGASLPSRQTSRAEEWVKWWKSRQPWIGLAGMASGLTGAILPVVLATVLRGGGWIAVCAATTIPLFGLIACGSLGSLMAWGMDL